jgi:hypothetical protein
MTTKRLFNCNICGGVIPSSEQGLGIKWTGASFGIELLSIGEAETHICNTCLDSMVKAYAEMRKA